ncbi:hypothetical protein D3105_32725 [Streptomyces globisporus]|uniref:Uncharacterized protein n=1 Tax=Streptomyces globisporus TaxID=1908 RepID=A0A423UQ24_STRGL|nr:hypothetical protein D3105_32725 [Streptomyces globisporus]
MDHHGRLRREADVEIQQLASLRSPIGLDLGARTPETRSTAQRAPVGKGTARWPPGGQEAETGSGSAGQVVRE